MNAKYKSLRQTAVCVVATLVVVACIGVWSAAASEPARAVVERFDSLLLSTMKQGRDLDFGARYDKLARRIDTDFDMPKIARHSLGTSWAALDAAQQRAYVARMRRMLIAGYARTYDQYANQRFDIARREKIAPDSRQVDAALIAPDGTRQVTRYTLADERGRWRVVRMSPSMGFDASRAAEIVQRDGAQAVLAWMDRGLARYPQLPKA